MYYVVWSMGWDEYTDSTAGGGCLGEGLHSLELALAVAEAANEDARRRGLDVGAAYIEDPETGVWWPTGSDGEAVVTDHEGRRRPVEVLRRRLAACAR